jgi:hypothetical protein
LKKADKGGLVRYSWKEWNKRLTPEHFKAYDATQIASPEIDIELNPKSQMTVQAWDSLKQVDDRVQRSWDHERDDMQDQSMSGYDMSLATFAAMANWTDQQICNLLTEHYRKWERPLKPQKYYERTILKARDAANRMHSWSVGEGSEEESASMDIELRVFESDPPSYEVTIFGRRIMMPAHVFTNARLFRRWVFQGAHRWPPPMKQNRHEKMIEALAAKAERFDLSDASDFRTKQLLVMEYLSKRPVLNWDGDDRGRGDPFVASTIPLKAGVYHVYLPNVMAHLKHHMTTTAPEVGTILRMLGFKNPRQVRFGPHIKRVWLYEGAWPPSSESVL